MYVFLLTLVYRGYSVLVLLYGGYYGLASRVQRVTIGGYGSISIDFCSRIAVQVVGKVYGVSILGRVASLDGDRLYAIIF